MKRLVYFLRGERTHTICFSPGCGEHSEEEPLHCLVIDQRHLVVSVFQQLGENAPGESL